MVQKLWCAFLKKKMESEMNKFHHLEEAFQKIRTSTGNSDVQEMVTKFLTKEQTYATLLTEVNKNEKKLDELRVANDQKSDTLHELKIEIDNDNQKEGAKVSAESQEILELHSEIQALEKDLSMVNNRKKNVSLVFDQVTGWSNKVITKLNKQILEDLGRPIDLKEDANGNPTMSVSEVFQNITDVVCGKLGEIIEANKKQSGDGEWDELNDHQYIDFATDEFINKNIRVRPTSGVPQEQDQKSEYMKTPMLGQGELSTGMDEEDKFNQLVNMEMEMQRKQVKHERERLERQKQLQAEMAIKAAEKKKK